jgi:hypothetical protein
MARLDPFGDPHGPSGRWSGHYHHDAPRHAGRTFPIHATLWHVRGRVEGVMSDEVTEFVYPLGKVIDQAESNGRFVLPLFKGMILRHPDAIVQTRLPTDSVLRGRLRGDVVTLTKTYEGPQSTRFGTAVATLASVIVRRHRVHYSGVFDPARGVIEGTWEIPRRGLFGWLQRPLDTGTFYLARVPN